jgi:hypothetical protein
MLPPSPFSVMNPTTRRLFCGLAAAIAAIVLHLALPRAGAAVIAFGSVVDPVGDAILAAGASGLTHITDLTAASISVDDLGNVTFTVSYAAGSFSPPNSRSQFYLDLDRNVATGSVFGPTPGLGLDALLRFPGPGLHDTAQVLIWTGMGASGYDLSPTEYAFTTLVDGYTATLPLSAFSTASPYMNFAVTAGTYIDETFVSGIQDVSSNTTAPVASVPDHGSTALLLGVTFLGVFGLARRMRSRSQRVSTLGARASTAAQALTAG